jgi:probable F420-dependent oxidoreductase
MLFGLAGVCTDETLRPGEVARRVEELGLESLFLGEHTHIPWSRESQYPLGPLPRDYWRTLDPFVALTDAAAASSRIRLGTAILQLAQRDPIVCAKEVASLDLMSDGRFELAVGAGWNLEEMRNHGTEPSQRFAIIADRIKAMREMWIEDEATFQGRYVEFDRIAVWPKPVQTPHPPVLLGGNGATAEQRVLDHADGWAPYAEPGIADRVRRFRAAAREAGREVSVTLVACPLSAAEFEELEQAGVDRCMHWMDSMHPDRFDNELAPFLKAIKEYE